MRNFLRALRRAINYWPSILLATCCSFLVAGLWGANIGAFYPILEVTIRGKSTQQWMVEEIARYDSEIQAIRTGMGIEEQKLAAAEADQRLVHQDKLQELETQIKLKQAQRSSYLQFQPWVDNYLPQSPFQTIVLIVSGLILSTIVRHFFLISNELLVGRVAMDISRNFRNRIFKKSLELDRVTFARFGNASFVTMATHTTEMLSTGLMLAMGAAIREPLKAIACLIGAGLICWRLLVLSVIIAPIVGVLLFYLTRKIKSVSNRVLERATGFHEVLLEGLENVQTIQSFRQEDNEERRFEDSTLLVKNFGLKFLFLTSLSKPLIEFLGIGMLGTTIIGGAYLVLNKETHLLGIQICDEPLGVSALLVFFSMLIGVSDPLRKLSGVYSAIYTGTIAADAIFPLLETQSTIQEPEHPVAVNKPHQTLTIDSVGFHYNETQPVLDDVSLEIPFGSTVAIIGSNGSGKSTLINLLCRFYDPTQGGLKLDGEDYRDMAIEDVRSRLAIVNQQTELFNRSVAYNICYGCPDASQQEIERVAKLAHAHDFITGSLESGYETCVGKNGNRLSGGQRQRIALARALLCEPEILILDEATSQIDMQSEQAIRESLAELQGRCTLVIITHREKLLELADQVLELKDGKLVELESNRQAA